MVIMCNFFIYKYILYYIILFFIFIVMELPFIILSYTYLLLGIYIIKKGDVHEDDEMIYFSLLLLLALKVLLNYKLCTVAYFECKVRGVKKEESYVNKFLDGIIDLRQSNNIFILTPITLYLFHYYLIKRSVIKEMYNKYI